MSNWRKYSKKGLILTVNLSEKKCLRLCYTIIRTNVTILKLLITCNTYITFNILPITYNTYNIITSLQE